MLKIKTKTRLFYVYRYTQSQGEYCGWHDADALSVHCCYKDDALHGEFKSWLPITGELCEHAFYIKGEEVIDFFKNPELYPSTPEEKTMFVLRYGNAPFIGEDE